MNSKVYQATWGFSHNELQVLFRSLFFPDNKRWLSSHKKNKHFCGSSAFLISFFLEEKNTIMIFKICLYRGCSITRSRKLKHGKSVNGIREGSYSNNVFQRKKYAFFDHTKQVLLIGTLINRLIPSSGSRFYLSPWKEVFLPIYLSLNFLKNAIFSWKISLVIIIINHNLGVHILDFWAFKTSIDTFTNISELAF